MGKSMNDYCVVEVTHDVLVGGGARSPRRPAIFVAYDFDSPESKQFKLDLESAIHQTAALATIEVLDGHSFVGEYWPTKVRSNLKKAKLTIADLSVLNQEVLFECGFAWGLGRPILPVASTPAGHTRMPSWFTDIQFGHYSSTEGIGHILDSIAYHLRLRGQRGARQFRRIEGNPRGVALIGCSVNGDSLREMVNTACAQYGMDAPYVIDDVSSLESIESSQVHEAVEASLFIGVLSGGSSDPFIHFAAGAVLSTPTSGESKARLPKRVLLVVPNDQARETMTPTSARKVKEVTVITRTQIHSELFNYGHRYENWRQKQHRCWSA